MRTVLLAFPLLAAALFAACGGASRENASRATATPGAQTPAPATPAETLPKIVAFGDSLTAGYGLSPRESYPALLQKMLDADGFKYEVVNAGVSGDTSAGGVRRIDWSLDAGGVRFVILELGANDFLRGQPVSETKKNLAAIIERSKSRGARVLLAGMYTTTDAGRDYGREIDEIFKSLAREHGVTLIPFFLEGVAGKAELNQQDGIHPNAEGTRLVAATVYRYLKPMLEEGQNK
ncbi:MAG TPA: arylesterase [Pyrinomonadaceae bacterium]|jgi:acyl-CoA thioesterase-1|nr:arylesterase [Pyrinomonadaceae bacterium]